MSLLEFIFKTYYLFKFRFSKDFRELRHEKMKREKGDKNGN